MQLIEKGYGAPLVFIPGLQGRWEYARPTVEALAEDFRVTTFALCDEPVAGCRFDAARAVDSYADQVLAALDATGCQRAALCGLSFGGLIALRFAAEHPERVDALVLASTPGPGLRLRRRHRMYVRFPRVVGPLFLVETPFRLSEEVRAALPRRADMWAFLRAMLRTSLAAPLSLSRMAIRVQLMCSYDPTADCARITAPTLVVTGEPGLDHVVPVGASSAYGGLIAGAEIVVLAQTGHIGSLTRPKAFGAIVADFVRRKQHAAA